MKSAKYVRCLYINTYINNCTICVFFLQGANAIKKFIWKKKQQRCYSRQSLYVWMYVYIYVFEVLFVLFILYTNCNWYSNNFSFFFFKLVRMIDAGVQYEDLQLIERDDLKELIPPFALRIRFREKLFTWKKNSVRCLITYTFFSLNTWKIK